MKDMYSLVEEARERFEAKGLLQDGSIRTTIGYGHIGDGQSSLSFLPEEELILVLQEISILISLRIDGTLRLRKQSSPGSTKRPVSPPPPSSPPLADSDLL